MHLYHPPLYRLKELQEGNEYSLVTRSKKFSEILGDVLINGVCKQTGLDRLAVLDQWVGSVLPERLAMSFQILDVGASDGSTTFYIIRYLREKFGVEVKATILEKQLRIHCFRRGCLRYYVTHDWSPFLVQFGVLGLLFEETDAKEGFVFNPMVRVAKKCLQRLSFEKYLQRSDDLLLVSPLVINSPNIVWLERDIFRFDPALVGAFDFIRCCNVLNCSYFSERQIYDAIKLLALYLKPKCLLLVARTIEDSTDSLHTASLWMKSGSNLEHIADLNGGSEVKKLVH